MWQKYKDMGVRVVGIHGGESAEQLAAFSEQTGVTFPLLGDEGSTRSLFAYPAGVNFPYRRDVVIGKDLTVHSIRNSFNVDEMDALVQRLLLE